ENVDDQIKVCSIPTQTPGRNFNSPGAPDYDPIQADEFNASSGLSTFAVNFGHGIGSTNGIAVYTVYAGTVAANTRIRIIFLGMK
ncbi:MAG: hypothetical protein WC341_16325, partial [Bacteroidales bacterium]